MKKKTPCECPLAGLCNRHGMNKTPHYHKLCQNHQGYFEQWENCKGPGQDQMDKLCWIISKARSFRFWES
jgi:hypothetical protein